MIPLPGAYLWACAGYWPGDVAGERGAVRALYAQALGLGQVDPELIRGPDGFVSWVEGMRNVWSEWRTEPEQLLDAGDRVVVFVHLHARGATGGTPLDARTAHVWTISEGRAVSLEALLDRTEALDAVGLRE